MNFNAHEHCRRSTAAGLALLLASLSPIGLFAQAYAPLDAVQLNQLVAPIALYPDALVAQILTASTYPQQVQEAQGWMQQYAGMPPDERARAIDTMPWDPSVKALTAFPSVMDNMARNAGWTGALGNAYYNQPGDVMNSVQAMRLNAQQAGGLRSTPQQRVFYNGGLIVIEPVNPGLVYVPYYDPWVVYGGPIVPWRGYYVLPPPRGVLVAGLAIGFGVGIGIGLYAHYGWGYHAWSPNWRGGVVVYNHTTYISRSTTVINRGNFGGYNRGVYEHAGAGVPGGFHPGVTGQTAAFGHAGPSGNARSAPLGAGRPAPSGYAHSAPAGAARPAPSGYAHNAPAGAARPGPSTYNRPGPSTYNRPASSTYNRPASSTYNRPAPSTYNRPAPAAGTGHPGPSTYSHTAPSPAPNRAPSSTMHSQPAPANRPPAGNSHEQGGHAAGGQAKHR